MISKYRQSTFKEAVNWSAGVFMLCSETVIYQDPRRVSNTTPWALKEELQDIKERGMKRAREKAGAVEKRGE